MKFVRQIHKYPVPIMLLAWFACAWSWVFFTNILNLAGSKAQGYVLAAVVFIINVVMSAAVIWYAYRFIQRVQKQHSVKWALALGVPIFAFADFLAGWLSAFLWIGPNGSVDNVLPMGSMALPITNTPLRFAGRFVGFYGLAGLVWLCIYFLLQRKHRRYALAVVFVAVLLASFGWLFYRAPNGERLRATIISEKLVQRVEPIDAGDTDLVIFPEYGLEGINNANLEDRIIAKDDQEAKSYFVGSGQVYFSDKVGHANSMMFGNTQEGITGRQDKYRLIPGGEDLPYVLRLLLPIFGQGSAVDYFSDQKGVIKGAGQLQPFVISNGIRVATAVCSSIISPSDYRHFTQSGATLLTNSASLAIFNNNPIFTWQHQTLARFMATANARYFLQSANSSDAYALDMSGNRFATARNLEAVTVDAQANTQKTPYTMFGEWLTWLGFVVFASVSYAQKAMRQSKPKRQK